MKSILVTGGAGYIGSVVIRGLLAKGYHVVCVDTLNFGGGSILGLWYHPNFSFYKCDITDFDRFNAILTNYKYYAVLHLAAIVGDPACAYAPDLAETVNWAASKFLLDKSIELGVRKFIFASTCSNYGKMNDSKEYVIEESTLAPVSLYAKLKVKFEKYMCNEIEKLEKFCPVVLRFATVYGVSPRMRFDLTVNEFTKELTLGRELIVFGENFWRPYCHVKDFLQAFLAILNVDAKKVSYQVYNVGSTDENYTKKMLVEKMRKIIPNSNVRYIYKNEDPRNYRVSFEKIKKDLNFLTSMTVSKGIEEIKNLIDLGIITNPDEKIYYNVVKN